MLGNFEMGVKKITLIWDKLIIDTTINILAFAYDNFKRDSVV